MKAGDPRLEWLRRYAEGAAVPEEMERMEDALREDAEFRRAFVEYMNVESALRDAAANAAPVAQKVVAFPAMWRRVVKMVAVAAVLMISVVLAWEFFRPAPAMAGVAAEVLESREAAPEWAAGKRVKLQDVSLASGSVKLKLENGVVLDLAGPLHGHFESPMRLRLQHGELNADVGEHGKGFTVVTQSGEVVDLGTRFGVDADESGSAEVAVFSGQVELHGLAEQAKDAAPVTLAEGDAVVMHPEKKLQRLQAVMMKAERMGQRLADRSSDLIANVSDNVSQPDFNCFYGVVPAGMGPGMSAYTDNVRLRWRPPVGGRFPAELVGADVVRTFLSTRHDENFRLQFTVKKSATVYVLCDQREPAPEWLKRDFSPTKLTLRCGPWKLKKRGVRSIVLPANSNGFVTFTVWKRRAAAGETVALGPLIHSDYAMYGIAVKSFE